MTKFQKIQKISSIIPYYSSFFVFIVTMVELKRKKAGVKLWALFLLIFFSSFTAVYFLNAAVMTGLYPILNTLASGLLLALANFMCVDLQVKCTNQAFPKDAKISAIISMVAFWVVIIAGVCMLAFGNTTKEYKPEQIVNHFNTVVVYQEDGNYDVVVWNNGKERTVVFSPDRKVLKNQGLNLIKAEDIESYIGLSREELEKELGPMHADTGSGFSFPSYITENGFLIAYYLRDGFVAECYPQLLFGGKDIYSETDFQFIEIGKTTYYEVQRILPPGFGYMVDYGMLCEYPLKDGGYMQIKFYGPDMVAGAIERVENSIAAQ